MKCPECDRPLAEVGEGVFRCLVCDTEFTEEIQIDIDVPEEIPKLIMGSGGYGVGNKAKTVGALPYNFTGVDPATGKDRKETILYNRDTGAVGRNDIGFVK